MNDKIKNNLIPAGLATALFTVQSLFLSAPLKNIFTVPSDGRAVYYLALFLSFVSGVLFWFIIFKYALCSIRSFKEKKIPDDVKLFASFFIPFFVILLLIFPGVFKGDEYYVLNAVKTYGLSPAQGGLTSFFYIACLRFFPSLFTIHFMQIFIISLLCTYIYTRIRRFPYLKDAKIALIILRLILFIPSVLDGIFFTLRATGAAFFFLAALIGTLYFYYDKESLNTKELVYIGLFSAFAGALRTELAYIFILLPEFIILFVRPGRYVAKKDGETKEKRDLKIYKPALILLILSLALYMVVNIPNKIATGKSNKYPISLVLNPVSNILHQEEIRGERAYDDIMAINELVDVQAYVKHSSVRNISQFWDIPDELPKEQLNSFMSASYDLILNNFGSFLKYRWLTFAHTNGLYSDEINHPTAPEAETVYTMVYYGRDYGVDYYFSKPVFPAIRNKIIDILSAKHYDNDNTQTFWYYPIVYNCIPLILIGLVLFVWALIKKDSEFSYMIFMIAVQLFLLFLTAPAMFFMYYYCFYLSGSFIIVLYVSKLIMKRKDRE